MSSLGTEGTNAKIIKRLRIGQAKLNGILKMGKHLMGKCDYCEDMENTAYFIQATMQRKKLNYLSVKRLSRTLIGCKIVLDYLKETR